MTKAKSDEPEMSDFGDLTEEMENAMAQARKATDELPPLEELAGIQEAMAGLARMGGVVEKMRLAAEEHEELIAELVGEPDWRVEAEIEVRKGASPLMKVGLTADFDLEIIVQAHEIASSDEGQTQIAEVSRKLSEELPLTLETNVPLKVSDERELCFEFAPALKMSVPRGDSDRKETDLAGFAPTIDEVRVDLYGFEPGKPFEHSVTVSQENLELEFKQAFQPL
jgi:hypothetical protein